MQSVKLKKPVLTRHLWKYNVKMQRLTLFVFAAIVTMALAAGQYYVPRAYYVIDAEGHASAPVHLRRLRRSLGPSYPYPYNGGGGASANANAYAQANSQLGGSANANANARANAGGWNYPSGYYGSAGPHGRRY